MMDAKYFVRFEDSDNRSDSDYAPFATEAEAKAYAEKVLRREVRVEHLSLFTRPEYAEILRVEDNQPRPISSAFYSETSETAPVIEWVER